MRISVNTLIILTTATSFDRILTLKFISYLQCLKPMKEFILVNHLEDLDPESKYLVHKAKEATNHAYAPYSKFLVGAAALLENGKVVIGSNQENAAYPSGMCAERVAVFAVASQFPEQKIVKMAVAARHKNGKE